MSENITKKYRPKRFCDVVGQPVAVEQMSSAVSKGIIPPAYLFSGIQGGGKTTSARLMAMSLNCKSRVGVEPCGKCQDCVDILNDCSDYLIEVDGATHGKVDETRTLMSSVRYIVPDGNYKVVIVDECHALTKQAWQSALKTIEEPPKNVVFIFCTTELQKVIATIKSRCVHIQFPAVTDEVIVDMAKKILASEAVAYDEDALKLIAKYASGSIRDAQSILEGFMRSGKVSSDKIKNIYQTIDPNTILTYFNNVVSKDIKSACNISSQWIRMGTSPDVVITALLEHLRNMLMDFIVQDATLKNMLRSQKEKIGEGRVADWIQFFYDQLRFMREYPMEHTLVIDLITIKLIDSMSTRKSEKTSRSTAKKEQTPKEKQVESPAQVSTPLLDRDKVLQLQTICGGSITKVHPKFLCATIKNAKGTVFDVVADPRYVENTYYILGQDLDFVLQDYPTNMPKAIKTKN